MSLATKVRAFEKRLGEARSQLRLDSASRVLILRQGVVDKIVTLIGEPGSQQRRVVSTQRQAGDTDESLTARHNVSALVAAIGPTEPPALLGSDVPDAAPRSRRAVNREDAKAIDRCRRARLRAPAADASPGAAGLGTFVDPSQRPRYDLAGSLPPRDPLSG